MRIRTLTGVILSLVAFASCGQDVVFSYKQHPAFDRWYPHHTGQATSYTEKEDNGSQLEYKIRDIDHPDTGYVRVYNDEYSLRLTALPLKVHGMHNKQAVYTHDGTYQDKAPFIIDLDVERFQDCAASAMYIHAIASQDYITVHDANAKAYSISPNGGNNREMSMCNSYSINKYDVLLQDWRYIKPGDMLIHGGYPGHVAVILDVIINRVGNVQVLIGQGWLPAVDFHVVWDKDQSDYWFDVDEILKTDDGITLHTQHTYYTFKQSELKRWKNR